MPTKNLDLEAFGQRLAQVRKALKQTQREFATFLGLKTGSLSSIEMGLRMLGPEKLGYLAKGMRVNLTWLMTGEGEMFNRPSVVKGVDLPGDRVLVAGVGADVPTAIEGFPVTPKVPPGAETIPLSEFVPVPILGAVAALGHPIENDHELPEGPPALLLKAKVRHPRDTYALRVRGDSMLPTLCDGFLVFVDRNPDALRPLRALDGKLVVVRLDQGAAGGISIKRLEVGRNALTVTADHPEAGFSPVALRLDQADRILAKVIGWWGEQ